MIKGRALFVIMAALAALLIFSPPSEAKKKKQAKPKAPPKMYIFDVGLGISYDDNILRYSESDLGIFETDTLPSKFSLKSKRDWIIAPQIKATLQRALIGDRMTSFSVGYDYYGYVTNDLRRYSRYTVEARQYFSSKGYGQISFGYIPKYYYRNLFVGTDPNHLNVYLPANFSKGALTVEVGYDITKNIKAAVGYDYQNKSYDEIFNYRDLNLNGVGANISWRAINPLRIWTIFDYESARAKGANMADTILDYSYNAWDITLGARLYASFLPKFKPEIYGSFQFRQINYTTGRMPDFRGRHLFTFGRFDYNYLARLGTSWRMPYQIRLEAEYAFYMKQAHLPNYINVPIVTQPSSQLEKQLNYKANVISFRISRQF